MKEFLIKIKTGADKDLTIGSFSGLTWGESLDEEENDRKTFTFNVSSQNSDLLEYIKIGRVIRLESKTPSFKKSFVISSIGPVEGKTENEDFFEVVAEDFASFIFSRNNVGLTLDTMVDDDYIEWLDSEGLDGNAEDLVNYILVRGRLKSTDESKEGSWKVGEDSDLSDHRVNLQLSDSNTYNALIEVALLTDTIMEFDYENKTISFYNRAENKRFDKGFQLSPYFNLADLNMTLTGETLFPILHMEGGEADTGMVVSAIPYLSYSSWERLHDNLKKKFDGLDSEGREKVVEDMKSGTFFKKEYAKRVTEEDPNDLGVLLGVTITEEEVEHIDSIPYLDSFLLNLDYYYENFIEEEEDEEKERFQSFLEMIYLNLGVANSNLQSKNIRNILIEEQVLRIERRINEAAEAVAASREDIYEDESNKLDSLFMKKGGRQSEEENYTNWIPGDDIMPGSNEKSFRDIYKGRYVFQEVDYDEYQYLKALENEEGEKEYSEDWDKESPLTGSDNPKLLHKAKINEETKYYFTNDVEKLRGLKIDIVGKNKNGEIEEHNVVFSDSSEAGMSSKTLTVRDNVIDNSKWENWDVDGYRQYSEKRHTVEIVDDLKENFEDWEDFFNDKAGDQERFKIEPEGKLRHPKLKAVDPELASSTKPVLERDWEFTSNSVDGYTKIIKTEDGFYRNLSGTELYSGSTNPSMSYPVRGEFYRNFDKNAQFYPLNNNITLVIEQGKRIGYVHKNYPTVFRQILRTHNQFIQDGQTYRVFFYSDSRFALSWGNENGSTIGLFIADDKGINISGSTVSVNSPIGTVTGGWYREKKLLDENITIESRLGDWYNEEEGDIRVNHIGTRKVFLGVEFSEEYLREDLKRTLRGNRFIVEGDNLSFTNLQPVLDDALIGVDYTIIGYSATIVPQSAHYKATIRFTLGEKEEGFYFMNTDTKKIEASTWDDPTTKLKAWQFLDIRLRGYGSATGTSFEGYDQIITHEDNYLFITRYFKPGTWWGDIGWSATGSQYTPLASANPSQKKLYLLQAYDSNTSGTGNIYFLGKDINNKANITRVTGEFNETIINYYGENMIWRGGNRFLRISSRGNIWVGTYQTVTGFTSEDAETKIEFPKILEMQPRIENNEKKWDYLPFRNTIFYKGKLGTSWRIEEGHTINLGERITQDEVEAQVSDGKIPLNAISYHLEEPSTTYSARQIGWGVRSTFSTIPSSELSFEFEVTKALIQHTKDSFDMLRFETPYLDLLNVFRGQDYIRDLNYKYRREIDFYINERKKIEEKIELAKTKEGIDQGEVEAAEREFYNSELEAIESEIGDANGYILPDKLKGLGDFWKYRTLTEYKDAVESSSVDEIEFSPNYKWKNYSAWLTGSDLFTSEDLPNITVDQDDLIIIEFRATGSFTINGESFNDPSGFWEKQIFVSQEEFVKVSGENIQIRSIKVVDPKDEKFIDTLNNLITWENEYIYEGESRVAMTPPDASEEGEGVTIDHMRVFLTQPEKYTGAFKESEEGEEGLGYSTIKGRLTLKQNRFEYFMWDRESRATKAFPITYEKSTHGELKDAREEREKIWFELKQKYPEFLLEGYYTNETENDAYNLLQQAKASYKYHNKPSEEYSITYIEAQDLVGDANDVRVGDKVAIKSRMRDQLGLSDRLQVTAISRELRDPGNIQIEVSPIRRDNLLEKVFGLVKRK